MSPQALAFLLISAAFAYLVYFHLAPYVERVWFSIRIYNVSRKVAEKIILAQMEQEIQKQTLTICLKAGLLEDDAMYEDTLQELAKVLARNFGYSRGAMHYQDGQLMFVFYGGGQKAT